MKTRTRAGRAAAALACVIAALACLSASGPIPPDEEEPFGDAQPGGGVIVAWNCAYPEGNGTARWYARTVGFTDTFLHSPDAAAVNVPYLRSGVRIYTSIPPKKYAFPEGAAGLFYYYRKKSRMLNPFHPEAQKAILWDLKRRFADPDLDDTVRDSIHMIVVDTEGIVAPPCTVADGPPEPEAVRLVEQAARAAGALGPDEPFPALSYGTAARDDSLFDEDGALRTDTATYRVLDWWWAQGAGPREIWSKALDTIRQSLPRVYAGTEPVCGTESRAPVPVFAQKAAGMDYAGNWFVINGKADRLPIYSAVMLKMAKASGLPVVQGPHFFPQIKTPLAYSTDLLLTSNLVTLAFNPRNGAADPDAPWGIMHWGMRRVTRGMTEKILRYAHKKAAPAIFANLEENQRRVVPAVQATRRFMEEHADLFREAEDIPAKVGVVLSKGGFYVAEKNEWWHYFYRIGEYPNALLMAHVPFEFVSEEDDLNRFAVLVVPRVSYVSEALVRRLARFDGAVTGSGVPEAIRAKIPGWVDPPPVSEVGNWPWGPQEGYVLGGHIKQLDAARNRAWMLDRAAKLGRFFAGLAGEPEVTADPETLVNVLRWRGRKVVVAVNHRMRPDENPMLANRCAAHATEIVAKGAWKGGRYDPEMHATRFAVEFDGPGAHVIVLEPR